jgi:hypothetical protein
MSLKNPSPGVGFVPEYQVSSWPYVTSSIVATSGDKKRIQFPGVTRWIQIQNSDHGGSANLSFGFTENCFLASNSNYFNLHAGELTARLELKCKELWITADTNSTPFNVIAGYTSINTGSFPVLTGSEGWQGVG